MNGIRCKRIILALAIGMAFGSLKAQEAKPTFVLTLDKALDIALSENPTVNVAGQEIQKKKYAKKGMVAKLFPQIDASAGYTRTLKKQVMYMGGDGGGFASIFEKPISAIVGLYQHLGLPIPPLADENASSGDGGMEVGLDNNWNGGFILSLPIYAPTLYKSIQMTDIDIELAVEQSRSSQLDLINQVKKAYFQLLLAQDSYEVLQQSYKQAEDNFFVVNSKFEQGFVSEYDKIRAEIQVRNLNPSLLQAKNAVALTKLQLLVLMGLDSNIQELEVVGQLSDYEADLYSDFMKVDTTLLVNNSDLRQMELQADMLRKSYEIDKTAYLPTISLSAMYQWTSMNDNFKFNDYRWNPYSTIGVTVSLPIFTGFARSYKIKQSKIQMEQQKWNTFNLYRNLNMQLENSVNNMRQSVEQLASNKENVNLALKGRSIAQKRYEVGRGTILELNDSELALTQSKLTYTQAIYDFLVAKADLDKLLGKDNIVEYVNPELK